MVKKDVTKFHRFIKALREDSQAHVADKLENAFSLGNAILILTSCNIDTVCQNNLSNADLISCMK